MSLEYKRVQAIVEKEAGEEAVRTRRITSDSITTRSAPEREALMFRAEMDSSSNYLQEFDYSTMPTRFFDNESDKFPAMASEKLFIAKLRDYHRTVSTFYYEPRVVEKVKEVVPWQKLKQISSEKAILTQNVAAGVVRPESVTNGNDKLSEYGREIFLMELLNWFRNDFFSWFDHGTCPDESCQRFGQPMSVKGSGQPTFGEMMFGATRIELYHCQLCGSEERFPRYNHPFKLLETRKGRCGEWANMITCMCVVFGYDSRLVLDFTDHVWTEVYSEEKGRWIHVDSCETSLDCPLLYETGWGKKLTYCIALHRYEIQDVTWRYVSSLTQLMSRRNQCTESWLWGFVSRVTGNLQKELPVSERNRLVQRRARELVDLLYTPWNKKCSTATELQGRQSGSEAWRLARNEMGKLNMNTSENFIFQVKDHDDFLHPAYEMKYNAVADEYTVNGKSKRGGWASGTYSACNISKKVEHDWKMVYLAREEGSAPEAVGAISWIIDLQDIKWSSMSVLIEGIQLEGARLELSILSIPTGIELVQSPESLSTLMNALLWWNNAAPSSHALS